MYFKRLEIIGFKSFANKTKLKFEPGVTAIVGPNGCGKSNISDAIKWVLGEQSAKVLRGSRMEDIIFNGTSSKEAINMAEVSLVLSNKDKVLPIDYEEVTITRRLFRSGESEYVINKMPVRLKDVNELLAGTGMGTSSYSIIEQGKIGQILSSKPEERRYIFEEASGITKYKIKKKEALRKLEHTENNLVRLNDIIGEVERQIKSIERQAKKAEKYKTDFDILKELELKFSGSKYKNINNELKAISMESLDSKKRQEELTAALKTFTVDRHSSKVLIDGISEDLQRSQHLSSETAASIEKNRHTIKVDTERIEELRIQMENLKNEIDLLEEKKRKREEDLSGGEKELVSISQVKELKQRNLDEHDKKLDSILKDIETFQSEIKSSKSKRLDLLSAQTKTKNELIKLGADIQNEKARLRRLKIERENIQGERDSLDNKAKDVNETFDSTKQALEDEKSLIGTLKKEMQELEELLKEKQQTIIALRNRKGELESKLEILKELIKNQEGFSKGVKAIRSQYQQSAVVADMITVLPGYEKAVESVLGDLAQSILVKDGGEKSELIRFIKEGNFGKANFIIREDAIRYRQRPPRPKLKECSHLMNFLKFSDDLKEAIMYLFRDTYLAASREEADEMFLKFKDRRFVTTEGYLREGPRVLAGSDTDIGASIVGRRNRVKTIDEEIARIISQIENETREEKSKEDALSQQRVKVLSEEEVIREKETEFANITAERNTLLNEIKKMEDESLVINTEIEDVTSSLSAIASKGDELNELLNKEEEESSRMEEVAQNCEKVIKERAAQKEETLVNIANLKGELSSINVSHDNISANLNMSKQECDDIKKEKDSKKMRRDSSSGRIDELTEEIKSLSEEKEVLQEKKASLESKILSLTDRKLIETEEFSKKEQIVSEKEEELEVLRNNGRDLEIKSTEIKYKKSSLIERINQAYKVELENLMVEIDENTDWDEMQERIKELKGMLDKMGPVNLVAIEEHKELEERYSFLTRQRDDLVNAKESLYKAITKINATTKKLFIETFQKVQVEFRNYFRMLFGGGHAEAFLLDERDILESGIEIVARPPGKKLQNILLLSGGEKALTAIALLFAIFKINPSPFCILDEIDAPLDETNIDRFTRVLQEFVKMSQFIMITHNKKTIQMADLLYGITMAEKGVSKIVSVKFAEDSEEEKDKAKIMV
ncbi:MAG: chromosome segregation protein SMC [Candidatus Omnitrophica bacterium]|nr:chromosome segregation protein SMC [Candidatus Omnitrophota bacterium]